MVDVYHELSQPQAMLRGLRDALKTNGRLVLLEYRKEDATLPIAPTHRLGVAEGMAEVEAEGFAVDDDIKALPRQPVIVFRQ